MIMSACVVKDILVVAVKMSLILVSHDPAKMEPTVEQPWTMTTYAAASKILMYVSMALRKHTKLMHYHAYRAEIVRLT